jgi:NAD(P)-dependent dehydrogenase (short-subunit alcohol dehydrogenase family)
MSKKTPTVLVTGANRGLGLEVCRQLGQNGLRVILTARDARQGRAAAERLASEKIDVVFRSLDVSDASSIATLATELIADDLKLDVLINNAAVALDGFDGTVARNTIAINFLGPLRVTEALLGILVNGSNIVMVSSGAGELSGFSETVRKKFRDLKLTRDSLVDLMASFVEDVEEGRYRRAGWPASAYRVSKAGLNALVRILAAEVLPRRIHLNAVCPGWVQTDMGGAHASRSIEKGAASIVWAALLGEDGPTGGFFRDGRAIPW